MKKMLRKNKRSFPRNSFFLKNNKAVVAETLTWMVATVIIIVILIFSIFVTSLLGMAKNFSKDDKGFSLNKEGDLFVEKSLASYLLTKDSSGETVFEQLKKEKTSNDFNENLALKIFRGLHSRDYFITLDIGGGEALVRAVKNEPYGSSTSSIFDERIYLAEELYLILYFNYKKK